MGYTNTGVMRVGEPGSLNVSYIIVDATIYDR